MSAIELLIESTARALPLLAAAWAFAVLFPRSPAAVRHTVLTAALAGCLLMPLLGEVLPGFYVPVLSSEPGSIEAVGAVGRATKSVGSGLYSGPNVLFIVWVSGALLLAARLGLGLRKAARVAGRAARRGRTMKVGRRGGTRVVVSPSVTVPMATGLLRPTVLLPANATRWTRAERRAVLRHEYAHLRRGDAWTLLLGEVARIFYWFNPLVWLVASRLRPASEDACDVQAASSELGVLGYADLLVRLARESEGASARLHRHAHAMAGGSDLGARVGRLVEGRCRPVRRRVSLAALAGLSAITLGLAAARPTYSARSVQAYADSYEISPVLAGMVLEAAAVEGIRPGIAFGLVAVESEFDPARRSARGAIGLAQILPSTAAEVAPGIGPNELWEPGTNLRVGFRLLRGYMDGLSGDVETALLAYAAGPRAARSALLPARQAYAARVLEAARRAPPTTN